MTDAARLYLKRHTERLVKDVGYAAACEVTGRSKATLGRYFSEAPEHADRFMPVDAVAALEGASSYPHVTAALAELNGGMLSYGSDRRNAERGAGVNSDVIVLSQRFAILMAEYHQSIGGRSHLDQRGAAASGRGAGTAEGAGGNEAEARGRQPGVRCAPFRRDCPC